MELAEEQGGCEQEFGKRAEFGMHHHRQSGS
jgi:hypothetical protein